MSRSPRPLAPLYLVLLAACAQPNAHYQDVAFSPSAGDERRFSYEQHAARVLATSGYEVQVTHDGAGVRGERSRDGTRDVLYLTRSAIRYGDGWYPVRFRYRIGAYTTSEGTRRPLTPELRSDVERLAGELEHLRATEGNPDWVDQLGCAILIARNDGYAGIQLGYVGRRSPDQWRGPRLVIAARPPPGLDLGMGTRDVMTIEPADADGGLDVRIWSPATVEITDLRDRMMRECAPGGAASPDSD